MSDIPALTSLIFSHLLQCTVTSNEKAAAPAGRRQGPAARWCLRIRLAGVLFSGHGSLVELSSLRSRGVLSGCGSIVELSDLGGLLELSRSGSLGELFGLGSLIERPASRYS